MAAVDSWLEGFLHDPAGAGIVLLIGLLLGLKHATDPDHLAAVSMALLSTAFGFAIVAGPIRRNFERVAPVLGALAAFGVWYAAGAYRDRGVPVLAMSFGTLGQIGDLCGTTPERLS